MQNIKELKYAYLMESPKEGERIRKKTNTLKTKQHLLQAGLEDSHFAIDIGCASGETTRIMSEIVGQKGKILGYDLSELRIKESSAIDKKEKVTNVFYKCGSVYDMSCFEDNTFDFVWSRFLFEYLKYPEVALKELKRIAKPGGTIAIADLDGNCIFNYPVDANFQKGLDKVVNVIEASGFDPYVGRKLYTYFINCDFSPSDINVFVEPYHQIFGKPSQKVSADWTRKINILEQNFKKLSPNQYENDKWVFSRFLEHINASNTITYSNIFIVTGIKK